MLSKFNLGIGHDISYVAEFTEASGELDGYYSSETHKDLWCLCLQEKANSKVLHTSDDPRDLIPIQKLYDRFTYIISPNGKLVKREEFKNIE